MRRGDALLLVQEQGPRDPAPFWALPGGRVEAGELLPEALIREVREETGLEVFKLGRLLYVTQHHSPQGFDWVAAAIPGESAQATAFIFEIIEWGGDLRPDDPDAFVVDARFLELAGAVASLEAAPRVMTEPLLAFLRGEVRPGAVWFYRRQPDGSDQLLDLLE
jgi:8-oxo-dGTP diphosphatase